MKQNSKGWYCSTPVRKSPDGKTVLDWCDYKPGNPPKGSGSPSTPNGAQSLALVELSRKADKILEGQLEIKQLLVSIGAREPVVPSKENTVLPF